MNAIKTILTQYASTLLLILTVIGLGYVAYDLYEGKKAIEVKYSELIGTSDKYKQLTAYTAQLESKYVAQSELLFTANKTWKEVAAQKDEQIKVLSDATFLIGKHVDKSDGPDYYFKTPKGTQNLIVNEIRIAGPDSPPIGYVVIKSDGATYKGNYQFQIQVNQLQTFDRETGKVKVYAKAFYVLNQESLLQKRKPGTRDWTNVQYPLPIVGGTALIDPTVTLQEKQFYWLAPRYVFGVNAGARAGELIYKPMLAVSLMGKGASKHDLDWRALQFGLDSESNLKNVGLNFVPFTFRPLSNTMVNTYLGPGIGWDSKGTSYFLNLSVGF